MKQFAPGKEEVASLADPVQVEPVVTRLQQERFVDLPWTLYREDRNWVPPLKNDIRRIISGPGNPLAGCGPREFFLAYRGQTPVGRIGVGVNEDLNRKKGTASGYVTLFESVHDYEVAQALFDRAVSWLRPHGIRCVRGPVSPTNGDDYRGLLVKGFDSPPVLMESYNPSWYMEFFERYGFTKHLDLYAYYYDLTRPIPEHMVRAVEYAQKRYGLKADPLNLRGLERDIRDIKAVLDVAMPSDWEDLTPPSLEEVREMAAQFKPVADPELIRIARTLDGMPVGFGIALPDLNQVLARLNGKLSLFNMLRFLVLRRHVTGVRFFILFVVPEYRNKGVTGIMFLEGLRAAARRGYRYCEGSTIGETNLPMCRTAEGAGGNHYKTYRIWELPVEKA